MDIESLNEGPQTSEVPIGSVPHHLLSRSEYSVWADAFNTGMVHVAMTSESSKFIYAYLDNESWPEFLDD